MVLGTHWSVSADFGPAGVSGWDSCRENFPRVPTTLRKRTLKSPESVECADRPLTVKGLLAEPASIPATRDVKPRWRLPALCKTTWTRLLRVQHHLLFSAVTSLQGPWS